MFALVFVEFLLMDGENCTNCVSLFFHVETATLTRPGPDMKHSLAFLTLALGVFAFAPAAQADGKAAIKPPVVQAPVPLQHSRLRPEPQNCCRLAPEPVQPRIISRTVSEPAERGIKLNDAFVLSMNGGVGRGVSDVGLGGGGVFGSTRGGDFGRSTRFRAARQFQRGRRGGRRGGRKAGGRR